MREREGEIEGGGEGSGLSKARKVGDTGQVRILFSDFPDER
jgi:hypothetical protein